MATITQKNSTLVDGVGNHYGSILSVKKGSSIPKFTISVAKPTSSWPDLKYNKGRCIRGAIWVLKNGVDISSTPNYYSTNYFNVDELSSSSYGDNYTDITFNFNSQNLQATSIMVGFVTWNESNNKESTGIPTSSLIVKSDANSTSYLTLDFTSGESTMPKGMQVEATIKSYEDDGSINKPTLEVDSSKGIIIRTLSAQRATERGKRDYPSATLDDTKIHRSNTVQGKSTQWNTTGNNHPWKSNNGFDFSKNGNGLQDSVHRDVITSSNNFNNSENPYWAFDRSRILITLKPYENASKAASRIYYKVDESSDTPLYCDETANNSTSLLICPRDEGIEDNELMTVRLWRCTYDTRGSQIGKSNEITIYFRTYANPTVSIAYPKNLPNGSNYALWANEVLNNKFEDSKAANKQICAALNMLLTKDSGDTSGLPIYTRIYISEFKGTYTADRKFSSPTNQQCLSESAKRIASWRGIQLDDGTIFQISGMKLKGFTWDEITEDAANRDHVIATDKDKDGNITYQEDERLYFRAGYKYVIKVRRFHSAAAGAASEYQYMGQVYPGATQNKETLNYPAGSAEAVRQWILNTNNVDIGEVESNQRWVGPADGTSALSWDSDETYPGFSSADAVVIDCVASQSANRNVIVTRPAVQEVGADHWITFGYKHISKSANGIEHVAYNNPYTNTNADNPNLDGSIQPAERSDSTGSTWSGHANTAKRITQMYAMLATCAHDLSKKKIENDIKSKYDGCDVSIQINDCNVYIDHEGYAGWNSSINDWQKREDTLIMDTGGNLRNIASDDYRWSEDWGEQIFYGYSDPNVRGNGRIYGNVYKWAPIINAAKSNGDDIICCKYSDTPYDNINNFYNTIPKLSKQLKCQESVVGLDLSHSLDVKNTDNLKAEFVSGRESSQNLMSPYWREGFEPDGYLYVSDTDKQYFSRGSQNVPGNLYKRVAPTQDCENGNPSPYIALPTRLDIKDSLTRVSHYLYFTCHIFGRIKVVWKATVSAEKTDKEGNTVIVADKVPEEGIYTNEHLGELKNIGTGSDDPIHLGDKDVSYKNILTVFGEDNGGLGRCLSADDDTAIRWKSDGSRELTGNTTGAIESPIKVRYTPLIQPTITNIGQSGISDECTRTHNEITLKVSGNSYTENNSSPSVPSTMSGKSSFTVPLSYGMYRSAMMGEYFTKPFEFNFNNNDYTANEYQRLSNPISTGYSDNDTAIGDFYNTDIFPSVGICNAMTVILVPHDRKDYKDLTKMGPNWFADRRNYEDISSTATPSAKSVIVADVAKNDVYKLLGGYNKYGDHALRTSLNCEFDYSDLFLTKNITTSSAHISDTRSNKLKENVWYDLVVVPVFTNEDSFGSNTYTDMNFKYVDGAGTVNTEKFGGGKTETVYYYGSTPLVVSKFVKFHLKKSSGGGGSEDVPKNVAPVLFETEPCILYPNVNTKRYNVTDGRIKEEAGFWLDNSFRVVIRGPHFRDSNTLNTYIRNKGFDATLESSLEEVTNGKLKGPDQCKDFRITDLMVHIGEIDQTVTYKNSGGVQVSKEFNSDEFQKLIEQHALDADWLNSYGIYTMRTNPEAFSKCTQAQSEDNDFRSVITGGALNTDNLEEYCNRLVIFNPRIVNAKADSAKGYYIQVRYLNNEYGGTQTGMWSGWYGGIEDDEAYKINTKDYNRGMKSTLNYYVPVRNYQDIFTGFRSFIKESVPGAGMLNKTERADGYHAQYYYQGSGSRSPKSSTLDNISQSTGSTHHIGRGNHASTQIIGNSDTFTDVAYDSMLTVNGNKLSPSDISSDKQYRCDTQDIFLEMNYVDYILRSMAKLYFANYSECLNDIKDIPNVTFEDVGWTAAMAYAYSNQSKSYGWPNWSNINIDHAAVDTNHTSVADETILNAAGANTFPINTNRYFRKPVGFREFTQLQNIAKHIVSLLRDSRVGGVATSDTDPKDSNGNGTGLGVLPIDPKLLNWIRLCDSPNEDTSTANRMIIGHESQLMELSTTTERQASTDSNYIQQLMQIISNKLTGR